MQWVVDQKEHVRVGKMGWERFADKDGRIFYRTSPATVYLTLGSCLSSPLARTCPSSWSAGTQLIVALRVTGNLKDPEDVRAQHDLAGVLSGTASTASEGKTLTKKQRKTAEKAKMLAAASGGTTAAGAVQGQGHAQGQQGSVFSGGFDAADAALAQAGTANFAQAATASATAWEGDFASQEDLGAATKPLGGAVTTTAATADSLTLSSATTDDLSPATTDDVAAYMKRVG